MIKMRIVMRLDRIRISAEDSSMNLKDFCSGSSKSYRIDTRNNWIMFVAHKRKNVFRKESSQKACEAGFRELEKYGFEFRRFGFGGTHVHFSANVPKRYSIQQAEIMLKRSSASRIFKEKPNFLKLYPDRHLWYEHHESIGVEWEAADEYIRNQKAHHNVDVVRDVHGSQTAASGDTAGSSQTTL
jgi:REP element-mobilizing transposase RayT